MSLILIPTGENLAFPQYFTNIKVNSRLLNCQYEDFLFDTGVGCCFIPSDIFESLAFRSKINDLPEVNIGGAAGIKIVGRPFRVHSLVIDDAVILDVLCYTRENSEKSNPLLGTNIIKFFKFVETLGIDDIDPSKYDTSEDNIITLEPRLKKIAHNNQKSYEKLYINSREVSTLEANIGTDLTGKLALF